MLLYLIPKILFQMKSVPGFSAKYSISNEYATSFRSTSKVNKTKSLVIPAISCDACERVCALSSLWDCLRCYKICDPPK